MKKRRLSNLSFPKAPTAVLAARDLKAVRGGTTLSIDPCYIVPCVRTIIPCVRLIIPCIRPR